MTINEFINSLDNNLYNKIRLSMDDGECRRHLKNHLDKQLISPTVINCKCMELSKCSSCDEMVSLISSGYFCPSCGV